MSQSGNFGPGVGQAEYLPGEERRGVSRAGRILSSTIRDEVSPSESEHIIVCARVAIHGKLDSRVTKDVDKVARHPVHGGV